MPTNLPNLVCLNDYEGTWQKYRDAIYSLYISTIANGKICYKGLPIRCRHHPIHDHKHASFWHIISEGKNEDDRLISPERCERILWISWAIDNSEGNEHVRIVIQRKGTETTHILWLHTENYIVVLSERNGYYLLKTAYPIKSHKARTLQSEWELQKNKGRV